MEYIGMVSNSSSKVIDPEFMAMERIMVEICWSRPAEKRVQAVSLSLNFALVTRFWNSLI